MHLTEPVSIDKTSKKRIVPNARASSSVFMCAYPPPALMELSLAVS